MLVCKESEKPDTRGKVEDRGRASSNFEKQCQKENGWCWQRAAWSHTVHTASLHGFACCAYAKRPRQATQGEQQPIGDIPWNPQASLMLEESKRPQVIPAMTVQRRRTRKASCRTRWSMESSMLLRRSLRNSHKSKPSLGELTDLLGLMLTLVGMSQPQPLFETLII